uniref:exodeoxyribonuclease III n=1 Tax=Sphenodon punctatus TaxID=8508 RepID=A0A8D0L8C1_SPHPU
LPHAPRKTIESFIFLTAATTGLAQPRVAELGLFAVHRRALEDHSMDPNPELRLSPRIADKLALCVDPQKPFHPKAEALTGLSNRSLGENRKPVFDQALVQVVQGFLARQAGPTCLVAHNGYKYDFPLLRTELDQVGADLPPGTRCLDTLPALRELEGAGQGSYKLRTLYKRYYGREPAGAHSAEGDTLALLMVFLAKAPELMEWAKHNARSWGEVRPMSL